MRPHFIKNKSVFYSEAINKVKKSKVFLQPIYEAFTNSIESISSLENNINHEILLKFYFYSPDNNKQDWMYKFDFFEIVDTGIGLNNNEFERMNRLFDNRKGPNNKGVGRVQFLHFFEKSEYESIYLNSHSRTGYSQRKFTLSKSAPYLKENSIIWYVSNDEIETSELSTKLILRNLMSPTDKNHYDNLTCESIKNSVTMHFLDFFCENKDNLPTIKIETYRDKTLNEEQLIQKSDIPVLDKVKEISINYVNLVGNQMNQIDDNEKFKIKAYKLSKSILEKNQIKLIGKGQIISEIEFKHLNEKDVIDDHRYMFLVSSPYLDEKVNEPRDDVAIPKRKDLKKVLNENYELFDKIITLDDITDTTNDTILSMYDEIRNKQLEKKAEIEKLRKMFLLSKETIRGMSIGINDTDEMILTKVYKKDAELIASKDAEIKKRIDRLESMDPESDSFDTEFEEEVVKLSKQIPLQNKAALSHYVARRKLVLEIFDKTLNRKLQVQQSPKRNKDERLLHNLILNKGQNNIEVSGLWIINEDFVYFDGYSETKLCDTKIGGKKVFESKFSEKELEYINGQGEKRLAKKPDILLFPDEGKCLILEFKAPNVNATKYLTQINDYASLIRNYSKEEFHIDTFYGYLIGENISDRDVRGKVSTYEHSIHLNYWFKPSEKVIGFDGRSDGSIYTEVIEYSTLLKRAKKRNSIFIDKLLLGEN